MKKLLYLCLFLGLLALPACDGFVEGNEPPIDTIGNDLLNDANQVQFQINGVLDMWAETVDDLTVLSDGLSDAFFFDQDVPNATFPTYRDTDNGNFTLDNNSVDGVASSLGEYRLLADTLLTRIEVIDGLGPDDGGFTDETQDVRQLALYVANLHGGIARYFLGAYFSLNAGDDAAAQPGGAINRSALIPQGQLFADAVAKMQAALEFAPSDYERRVANSLIARVHLFNGDYAAAQQAAQAGMMEGDDPFQALYSIQDANSWWGSAGRGRNQFVADFRFADDGDDRSPVEPLEGNSGTTYYRQILYPEQGSPLTFMSWQENALMLAELAVRNNNAGTALPLVNAVRAAAGLDALGSVNMDAIIAERDQELFAQGTRLIDQRRFDIFHLPAGTWRYLPITERERNDNPNID
ncbi:MAG TPA: RagB/SusD family nutrient uptake outer membrane protein [Rhodothermales bacterium]|nr:RagB/SusD family nutrient uptake outer membrane protein [Rhodothermales bacterium]